MSKRQKLGELLISLGIIDALQLQAALGHQRQWGVPLGKALVEKRFCTEDQILAALAKQTGVPTIQINLSGLDLSLAQLLPQRVAQQHRAVPLRLEGARGEVLVVALGGPANLASVDQVRSATGIARIVPYLAKDSDIDRAIDVLYLGMEAPAAAAPQGVNFEALPPPGAHLQGESEFDFGDDTPGPGAFMTNRAGDDATPAPSEDPPFDAPAADPLFDSIDTRASEPDLLDDLLGGPSSAATLSRPAPPPTPPAPAMDPIASVRPPPLPRAVAVPAHHVSVSRPVAVAAPPVIIYGWPLPAAELLKTTLAGGGIPARIVEVNEALASNDQDVIIAPLPLIESVVAKRQSQLAGNVIVAVKTPESDLHRAQRVGAKGYLATPVDGELLLRAVRRCRRP